MKREKTSQTLWEENFTLYEKKENFTSFMERKKTSYTFWKETKLYILYKKKGKNFTYFMQTTWHTLCIWQDIKHSSLRDIKRHISPCSADFLLLLFPLGVFDPVRNVAPVLPDVILERPPLLQAVLLELFWVWNLLPRRGRHNLQLSLFGFSEQLLRCNLQLSWRFVFDLKFDGNVTQSME